MSNMKQKAERKTRARSSVAIKEKPGPSNINVKKTTVNKRKAPPKETNIQEPVINDVKQNGRKRKSDQVSGKVKEKKQKILDEDVIRAEESSDEEAKTVKGEVATKRRATKAKEEDGATRAKKAKKVEPKKITKAKAGVKRQKAVLEVPKLPTISGTLLVLGNNETGQLGLVDVMVKKRPAENPVDAKFVDVAAGGMHSLCLTDKGEVYTFGCNDESALGRQTGDDEELEQTPMKVDIPDVVVKISAGDCHSAALTENGKVYIWGTFRDNKGIIGLTPKVFKSNNPLQILENVTVVDIASGSEHFVCLSNEGGVYTCGCGETGQLGRIPERSSKGTGRKGLDLWTLLDSIFKFAMDNPSVIDYQQCLLLIDNGEGFYLDLLEPKVVPLRESGRPIAISKIWTGADYTFLKSQTKGAIYAFGLNNYYQLGLPLKLGEDGVEGPCAQYKPLQINSFSTDVGWQCVSGGQHHTLALDNNGLVHVLGRREYGRLGLGQNCDHAQIPTVVPALAQQKCVHISCGDQTSFSVADNGALYSWGFGTNHQLGHGNDEDVFEPQIVEGKFQSTWDALKVSGGGQHTLILANRKEINTEEEKE